MADNLVKGLIVLAVISHISACSTEEDFIGGGGGGTFSATVSWTAPDTTEGGGILAPGDISGYKVYYGTTSGAYFGESPLISCSTQECEATVSGIPEKGTYFYVITAIDKQNRESTYSQEQSVTI